MTDNNLWALDRETTIYSYVEGFVLSKLKSKYPELKVTQDDNDNEEATFPTVYIHFLQSDERGEDLEGTGINAVYMTAQVEIYVTKTQNLKTLKEVSSVVIDAFKSKRFKATMPEIQTNTASGSVRAISRFSRLVGYNDTI